jgi:hypothetical protein
VHHRTGLPARRVHRGRHHTATAAPPTATNFQFYPIDVKATFRLDELTLPPGLRDRVHRARGRATTTTSSPPPPSSLVHSFHTSVAARRRVFATDSASVALHTSPRVPEPLVTTADEFIATYASLIARRGPLSATTAEPTGRVATPH